MKPSPKGSADQDRCKFFVRSSAELLERTSRYLDTSRAVPDTWIEAIYFDDEHLTVPIPACVRATRRLSADREQSGAHQQDYVLDIRTGAPGRSQASLPSTLPDAPATIARILGIHGLRPWFATQYRRRVFTTPGGATRLTLDTDVKYFSVGPEGTREIGEEINPRAKLQRTRRGVLGEDVALDAAIATMNRLPLISKKWMGYYYLKRAQKRRLVNELPGFEYETKLNCEHLDVDLGCLPFPVLEMFQSETIRRYYDDYHVSFRGGRATIVSKAHGEDIAGVLKRAEVKQKERSTWDLPIPRAQMRRTKRSINVYRPANGRVYTIALEICRLGHETRHEIEIEYDGTLEPVMSLRGSRSIIEAEIIGDLLLIRDALVDRHGFKPSLETKRDWIGMPELQDVRMRA